MKTVAITLLALIITDLSSVAYSQKPRHPFLGGVYFDYDPGKAGNGAAQPDSIHVYQMQSTVDSGLVRRSHYRYDPYGSIAWADEMWRAFRTDLQEYMAWDTTSFLSCDYDNQGNLTGSLVKVPDEDYLMKSEYLYSENNLRNREIYTRSFDGVIWDSVSTLELAYDSQKRLTLEWEEQTNYNSNLKKEYTYNAQGLLTRITVTCWSDLGPPGVEQRRDYTYDENNRLLHVKFYGIWGNPSLFLDHEDFYEYTGESTVIVTGKSFNYDGSMWYHTRDTYRHDEMGRLTSTTRQVEYSDAWVYQVLDSSVYDYSGRVLSEAHYDYSGGTWHESRKMDYVRDGSGNILRQLEYQGNDSWVLSQSYIYFYSEGIPVAEQSAISADCFIFPNPAGRKDAVIMNPSDGRLLTVYSMQGHLLYRQEIGAGLNRIDYEFPGPGIYLIKVTGADIEHTEKIIVP
jgi:hypothetical protein